jgi:hypothetical protein
MPEEMLAELQELRADRVAGAQLLDAARARADQDRAALREAAAERDRWQSAAESMRGELWRQIDELRAESARQHDQITQLSQSLAALLEAIVGTTPSAEAVEAAAELSADLSAAEATVATEPAPVVLAPYVPANEPPRPHLEPKPEAPEFIPDPDHDRVGVFAELMAVAGDSMPAAATGSAADRATDESLPAAPTGMDILPAAEPVPAKRRRLPRLSS